jgi:hypothetical protein
MIPARHESNAALNRPIVLPEIPVNGAAMHAQPPGNLALIQILDKAHF